MQMYACQQIGKNFKSPNASEFKGVQNIQREYTSLKINKEERLLFQKIGFDASKDGLVDGSLMVYPTQTAQMASEFEKLLAIGKLNVTQSAIVKNIIKFLAICFDSNYIVRFY